MPKRNPTKIYIRNLIRYNNGLRGFALSGTLGQFFKSKHQRKNAEDPQFRGSSDKKFKKVEGSMKLKHCFQFSVGLNLYHEILLIIAEGLLFFLNELRSIFGNVKSASVDQLICMMTQSF